MPAVLFGIKYKKKLLAKPNNAKKSAKTIGKSLIRTGFRKDQHQANAVLCC